MRAACKQAHPNNPAPPAPLPLIPEPEPSAPALACAEKPAVEFEATFIRNQSPQFQAAAHQNFQSRRLHLLSLSHLAQLLQQGLSRPLQMPLCPTGPNWPPAPPSVLCAPDIGFAAPPPVLIHSVMILACPFCLTSSQYQEGRPIRVDESCCSTSASKTISIVKASSTSSSVGAKPGCAVKPSPSDCKIESQSSGDASDLKRNTGTQATYQGLAASASALTGCANHAEDGNACWDCEGSIISKGA